METATKVTCLERFCVYLSATWLHIFNIVDLIGGVSLITFGLYMRVRIGADFFENLHTSWFPISSLLIGTLLVLTSLLSVCAILNSG
jgi:hypothetical protein